MLFQGKNLTVNMLDGGIAELTFDAEGSVNVFDRNTFQDFITALDIIKQSNDIKGLLINSAKSALMVGADITEFLGVFEQTEASLIKWIKESTDVFDALEDLNIPTLASINGFALGGGCELILACDYRVAATDAKIGLPEIKLGIMPGFGGTVRLPRLIGADNAIEWITTARVFSAEKAMKAQVVDALVAVDELKNASLRMLTDAINGDLNWQAKRAPKLAPLSLSKTEAMMSFSTCKAMVFAKAGKHYPAPIAAVNAIETAAPMHRAEAMLVENKVFASLAKTDAATAQVGLFLADQVIKSTIKKAAKTTTSPVSSAAVLGAGIMGGGIAYQSAYKDIPIIMKDINNPALNLGLTTAANLLTTQVERGRINADKLAKVLNKISATLSYDSFSDIDVVIEAVVENPKIKGAVLTEVEQHLSDDAIITSNTSTISIDLLAQSVTRKARFCGMHFFNPVHKMPLVEIIRGKETSDETVAKVVDYAAKMGKSPIVVNDCPGFYVNRVLFPYLSAFSQLVLEGVDFQKIDKVMEKEFGWPMGPAYLLDVVGIDTANHCVDVMANGFPTRMKKIENDPVNILFNHEKLGQKNGTGFYQYSKDKKGKEVKAASEDALSLLADVTAASNAMSPQDIINRLMIPMVNEVIRCIEEDIISTPEEADMGLIYGLGFPPFRGGAIRYLETIGLESYLETLGKYHAFGEAYHAPQLLLDMVEKGLSFYPKANQDNSFSSLKITNA